MTFKASHGLHPKAVHLDAAFSIRPNHGKTLAPLTTLSTPATAAEQASLRAKLVSLVPCLGLLASAGAEYGFEIDFPLPPTLWLTFACCVLLAIAARSAVSGWACDGGSNDTGAIFLSPATLWADTVGLINTEYKVSGALTKQHASSRRGLRNVSGKNRVLPIDDHIRLNSSGVIFAEAGIRPVTIILFPQAARGPPCTANQNSRIVTQTLCPAPFEFPIHFPRSTSFSLTATTNPVS